MNDFHRFVVVDKKKNEMKLPAKSRVLSFFSLILTISLFSFFRLSYTDAVLLGVAESQSGKQRVRHLPVQTLVTQQAETWT
jgi:hypothetical protein